MCCLINFFKIDIFFCHQNKRTTFPPPQKKNTQGQIHNEKIYFQLRFFFFFFLSSFSLLFTGNRGHHEGQREGMEAAGPGGGSGGASPNPRLTPCSPPEGRTLTPPAVIHIFSTKLGQTAGEELFPLLCPSPWAGGVNPGATVHRPVSNLLSPLPSHPPFPDSQLTCWTPKKMAGGVLHHSPSSHFLCPPPTGSNFLFFFFTPHSHQRSVREPPLLPAVRARRGFWLCFLGFGFVGFVISPLHRGVVLEPPRLWDGGTETFRLWLVGEKRKRGGK